MANVLNVGCKDIRGYCHKTDTGTEGEPGAVKECLL